MTEFLAFLAGLAAYYGATRGIQHLFGGGGRKLSQELKQFFGGTIEGLPIVSRNFATVDLANLQIARAIAVVVPGPRDLPVEVAHEPK